MDGTDPTADDQGSQKVMNVIDNIVALVMGPKDDLKPAHRAHVAPEHVKLANEKAAQQHAKFDDVPIIDFAPFYTGDAAQRAEVCALARAALHHKARTQLYAL